MFDKLLGSSCQQAVVGRDGAGFQGVPFLSWVEVFEKLDNTDSSPFVERIIMENIHLNVR